MYSLRRSSVATFILVFPCLMFVFVKVSERNRAIGSSTEFNGSTNTGNGNEAARSLLASSSSCTVIRCDCDTADNALNAFNTETTTSPVTTSDESGEFIPSNSLEADSSVKTLTESEAIKSKVIYVITPTYTRATQMPDMTRLAQTLMLVKDIFWIVSEDANEISGQVTQLLERSGLPHVHLLGPRPVTHKDKRSGRGVSNRLKALQWLRQNFSNTSQEGVIYFADDDNAYDVRIFNEMRDTRKVSVWPVGCLAKIGVSSPVIDSKTGLVSGFHDPFTNRRKFAVDMAGFAVDLQLFLKVPKATMPYKVGYEEDYFIKSLGVQINDLEPKADNCTQTLPATFPSVANLVKEKKYINTNLAELYKNVIGPAVTTK